jgi:hypothetical protein
MLIKFECNNPECNNSIDKMFRSHKEIPPFLDCASCGTGKLERVLGAPMSKTTVVIDNGIQAKQVEVSTEVVLKEENKARSK